MENCPWCQAEASDTFSFACGSVRPSYVTPSAAQADRCKIGLLEKTAADLYGTCAGVLEWLKTGKNPAGGCVAAPAGDVACRESLESACSRYETFMGSK